MATKKKLTAVEWLVNHFDEYGIDYGFFQPIIEQAKEKEKQQIIDAGNQTEFEDEDGFGICDTITKGEQYYKETFKNQ